MTGAHSEHPYAESSNPTQVIQFDRNSLYKSVNLCIEEYPLILISSPQSFQLEKEEEY